MSKNTLILIALFILGGIVGSCSFTEKIRDGRTAYERKQYAIATEMLSQEYESAVDRSAKATIAYYLGMSYQRINDNANSVKWFGQSVKDGFGADATLALARALKQEERYEEAAAAFQKAGEQFGDPRMYRGESNMCDIAQQWLDQAEDRPYKVEALDINSPQMDYSPFPYGLGEVVFTSDRSQSVGSERYKWTNEKFSTLFIADLYGQTVELFDPVFITSHNEGNFVASRDGTKAAFVRCDQGNTFDQYCKIYYVYRERGLWSEPIEFEPTLEEVNYSYPSLSGDGRLMFFSANIPNNRGGYDLYVSEFSNGIWQDPIPLSNRINTPSDEISPFIYNDTLYFASNNANSMGGYDIFRTHLDEKNEWIPPLNMRPPVNSGADDFGFSVDYYAVLDDNQDEVGYFTSSRKGGMGKDDIYRYEKIKPMEGDSTPTDTEEDVDFVVNLNLISQEKEFEIEGDPNSPVKFRKPLPNVKLEIFVDGKFSEEQFTDDRGYFRMNLDVDRQYEFIGRSDGYISNKTKLSTVNLADQLDSDTTLQARVLLEKIYYDKEIVLENIYYDFDRWEIRSDAEPTLNELTELLAINTDLLIQIASHTDCRGTEEYNQTLSQRRAQSVVNYLIKEGINADRLIARGFGESQPAIDCICEECTEEEHQINRRTTFAIIEDNN